MNLAAQGRARRGRATPSPSRCGPAIDSIARRYGARAKVAEIPPGPAGALDARGRGLRGRRRDAAGGGAAGASRCSRRRRAWWTWTGRSRRRSSSARFRVDRVRAAAGGRERGADHAGALPRAVGRAGRHRQLARRRARPMAIVPRLPLARPLVASRRCSRCRWRRRTGPQPLARFVTVDSDARARRARVRKDLRPVDLRDRRRGRRDRVAGVRDPRDEPRSSTRSG